MSKASIKLYEWHELVAAKLQSSFDEYVVPKEKISLECFTFNVSEDVTDEEVALHFEKQIKEIDKHHTIICIHIDKDPLCCGNKYGYYGWVEVLKTD